MTDAGTFAGRRRFCRSWQGASVDDYVELGLISSHDGFDPAFLEAAFSGTRGDQRPVETAFGFHIIKITEKEETGVFTFEDD